MFEINGKKKISMIEEVKSLFSPLGFKYRHGIVRNGVITPHLDEVKLGIYCANLIADNKDAGGFLALTKSSINAMNRELYLLGVKPHYQTHEFKNPITFGGPAKLALYISELFTVIRRDSFEHHEDKDFAINILDAVKEKYDNDLAKWRIALCFNNPFSYEYILEIAKDESLNAKTRAPLLRYLNSLGACDYLDNHRTKMAWAEDAFVGLQEEHQTLFEDNYKCADKLYSVDAAQWQLFEVDKQDVSKLVMLRLVYRDWLEGASTLHTQWVDKKVLPPICSLVLAKSDDYSHYIFKEPFSCALEFCYMGSIIETGYEVDNKHVADFNKYGHFYN